MFTYCWALEDVISQSNTMTAVQKFFEKGHIFLKVLKKKNPVALLFFVPCEDRFNLTY